MNTPTTPHDPTTLTRPRAGASGLLAAIAGLAAGELVAGTSRTLASPVLSIGNRIVDNVPRPLKDLAIAWFGTNDKLVLLIGILVVLAGLAAGIGLHARRSLPGALAAAASLAVVGMIAAALDPVARLPLSLAPALATGLVAVPTLLLLVRAARTSPATAATSSSDHTSFDRRRFLATSSGVLAASALAAGGGRMLGRRFDVAGERAELALPAPGETAPPVPAGAGFDVDGLSSFITPNDDFYRIDTALQVPRLTADGWTLRVHGMVEREVTFTFEELLAMPAVERVITMTCVSNQVGGDLVGTATWQGVRLSDLLDRVGVDRAATQVVGRAHDGWTAGFPVEAAAENESLVVYGMNGEPLPAEHGFPLRLVTPGLYGYVSATKWLTEVELTTFEAFDQYWVARGWDERAPIKVQSRIDTPEGFDRLAGTVAVAGVAWAQTRGIERVEVRVDDGPWQAATLADAVGVDTWRQWLWEWDTTTVSPGRHQLTVRATDKTGTTQPVERTEPFPNGADGWHNIAVFVEET